MSDYRDEVFEHQFERVLNHYSSLIKFKCRQFEDDKFDRDDLYSESSIVLLRIVRHHSDLGYESNEFKNLLMKSIKNRMLDLRRTFHTQRRDRFKEVSYVSDWDDDKIADEWFSGPSTQPDKIVEALQLATHLNAKLCEADQRMLSQLLSPSDELLAKAREKDEFVKGASGRRSNGVHTEIPVYLLGQQIGLSYKQSLRSLQRIRATTLSAIR